MTYLHVDHAPVRTNSWVRTGGAILALGAAGLAWTLIEAQAFTVRRVYVPVLPAGAQPVRILHLSDLHLLPRQQRKIAWLRHLADLEPDLVIDTGDNMAHRQALPAVLEALGPLLRYPGAFVMGSNDYYAPTLKNPLRYLRRDARGEAGTHRPAEDLPGRELGHALVAAGWQDLTNGTGRIDVGGLHLDFIGVDDPHLERDQLPAEEKSDQADDGGARLRIGVAHAPYQRVLAGLQQRGCALVLAGHTHGGQLCVPGYGALVTNCDLDRGRASGLHPWPGDSAEDPSSLWLHVSNGLGTSPYTPVRLACRPSVTLVTLTPSP